MIGILKKFNSSVLTLNEIGVKVESIRDLFYLEEISKRAKILRLQINIKESENIVQ